MDTATHIYEDELGMIWNMKRTEGGMVRFFMPSRDCEFEDPEQNGYYFDTDVQALYMMKERYGEVKLVGSRYDYPLTNKG